MNFEKKQEILRHLSHTIFFMATRFGPRNGKTITNDKE
jgi:hypothetical protein